MFVHKEFKELINDSIINELLEMKNDDFNKKQLSYFFYDIKIKEIKKILEKELFGRDDIIIDDELIIYKNQVTDDSARMKLEDDKIYLICNNKDNPLVFALNKYYDLLFHLVS